MDQGGAQDQGQSQRDGERRHRQHRDKHQRNCPRTWPSAEANRPNARVRYDTTELKFAAARPALVDSGPSFAKHGDVRFQQCRSRLGDYACHFRKQLPSHWHA